MNELPETRDGIVKFRDLKCCVFRSLGEKALSHLEASRYEITRGRVLNGELYVQRLQKLIYLHIFTDCFILIVSVTSSVSEYFTCV